MFGSSTKFKGSKKIDTLIQVILIQALTYLQVTLKIVILLN
jgi:hypothetical protein